MVNEIEAIFPKLRTSPYRVTSPRTKDYNCIAWAAGDVSRWWWPDDDTDNDAIHWPPGIALEETVSAFVAAFATLGYSACANEAYEVGLEKIALFADATGLPTHAARQAPNGRWTCKLGFLEDIEHGLHDLDGSMYGAVARILARKVTIDPALPLS
ncbi:MAG TPA: hypothetical protein VGY66_13335 [Gemmataceae bacterium]|jgi:hypothetical protein|nr:hypothetical protein [Gemmataceae bacterium]